MVWKGMRCRDGDGRGVGGVGGVVGQGSGGVIG